MVRNSIALVAGVFLSFALNVAGSRLAWLVIIGNVDRSENKDAIVRLTLWQTFGVVPAVAVLVGALISFVVYRSAWWLGGVAVLPLFVYGVVRGAAAPEIVLSVVYVALAFASALVGSRFKRRRPA